MKCPYCKADNDKVIDSRTSNEGAVIRRRRHCEACSRRFTTYERIEESPLLVVKKDQRREPYERGKVMAGILKACEKRPVGVETMEKIVNDLEKWIYEKYDKEVPSTEIGEFVMKALSETDEVAYVRFASVYRQFTDLNHFMKELKFMLSKT